MRRFAILWVVFLSLPATVYAADFSIGVGLKGGINGSISTGIDEGGEFTLNGDRVRIPQGPDLYPLFGLGGAVGPLVEFRYADIVGLEVGLLASWDNGNGFEDQVAPNGTALGSIDQSQRTQAWHLPILAKVSIPGTVRPVFGAGIELVFQHSSELEYTSDEVRITNSNTFGTVTYEIEPSTYALVTLSFGLEFKFKNFRIPIEGRASINPGFSQDIDSRLDSTSGTINNATLVYDGQYLAHLAVFAGVVYDFDFKL